MNLKTMKKTGIFMVTLLLVTSCAYLGKKLKLENNISSAKMKTVTINNIDFNVKAFYEFFTWENLPKDLKIERLKIVPFTNTNGDTHYYEVVYMPEGTLNWYQAAVLADEAGGYLACVTSKEENDFIFSMVDDKKYFWEFPKYIEGDSKGNHYEIMMGPMLGGYQPEGAKEPDGGWCWLSGEKWIYSNWAKNLDDGIIDKDPRDNTQPNNTGPERNQRTIGFGELNQPVPTWGDYSDDAGTYGLEKSGGERYAFIIEYNKKPI